jgi:hypothetical protein
MSDTRNVKLGVCQVLWNGVDLGYTQGGVEVTVKTDTHKVNVDQFGKTTINEYILGREVSVKVPLAETTLANLLQVMPGSIMVTTGGGVAATGSITVATQPAAGSTCVVNGVTFTFVSVLTGAPNQVLIGNTVAITAAALAEALFSCTFNGAYSAVAQASYAIAAATPTVVGITFNVTSVVGNAFTITSGTAAAALTVSGATLTGGTSGTNDYVTVSTNIGANLLATAAPLRLHPITNGAGNLVDDFVIPLAATAGAISFAYNLEKERIFNVEFTGYPNSSTGQLFTVGT